MFLQYHYSGKVQRKFFQNVILKVRGDVSVMQGGKSSSLTPPPLSPGGGASPACQASEREM